MKNRITATRNTCFAIISAIETDLRTHIVQECEVQGLLDILPDDIRESATRRWHADHSSSSHVNPESDFELIDYTDILDLSKLLHRTVKKATPEIASTIKAITAGLERVAPVRNRVCHTRPLEPEDLSSCVDLSDQFAVVAGVEFAELKRTRTLLEQDSSFVLGLQIPVFWATDKASIHHNLPLPEFDDTGFLGRNKDRQALHNLLRSRYPVVTVVGEGGVGKTALALRCLYDLLDADEPPYDAIVWASLKMTALTEAGVVQLSNDVATTLNLLGSVADSLGTPSSADLSTEELFDEIGQYLTEYRVLVAIDNLETLASASLRNLLLRIPQNSKLLITSRVGIGEFETRYLLESLDRATSVALMRRFAHVLGVTTIYKAPDSALRRYAKSLFNNPLLLKWFTSGIARGLDPTSLLDRAGTGFQEVLKFCFANVFDKLNSPERNLIDTLVSARRPLTAAEIYFLNPGAEQTEIEWALGSLHKSSIVKRTVLPDGIFSYQLSEPAASYVSSNESPSAELFNAVQTRMRELRQMAELRNVTQARYPYEIFSVRASSRDERIAAVLLSQALDLRSNNVEAARLKIQEAKRLLPTFGEVYRVSSLIEAAAGELYQASVELDRAVDYDPNSTIARYTYAQFLIRELEDFDAALKHLEIAERLDPKAATLQSAKALVLSRLGRCSEAAKIYEALLGDIHELPRRWRITTRDQAADCYRRWAESDRRNRDAAAFSEHVQKAINLVSEAVKHNDFDDRTVKQLGRALQEGIVGAVHAGDLAAAEQFIHQVESVAKGLLQPIVPVRNLDYILRFLDGRQDLIDRVAALSAQGPLTQTYRREELAGPTSDRTALGASRSGQIDNLPPGVKYGFIEDQDEDKWFFHYNSLLNKNDWSKLRRGAEVKFVVGENYQGRCAVSVSLVSLSD